MKKIFLTFLLGGSLLYVNAQNSFNAIKTSHRGGIMTTLVNPADLAGMPQKFDLNLVGFDLNVSNNTLNFTSSELGKTDDLKDRFLNSVAPEGFTMRVNADVVGPSLAIALNKKTTVGLITRGRVFIAMNNIDVALGKSIIDGNLPGNVSGSVYQSPNINNMSMNIVGWAELGLTGSREIFKDKKHSLKIGGTVKALFSGAYANIYMNNLKFTATQTGSNVSVSNASGNLGIEYNGSNDPLKDISSNLLGGPSGVAFDAGLSYQLLGKKPGTYIVKLGASLLDVGSMNFNLNRTNSRQFSILPGPHDPTKVQGSDLDAIIASVKSNNIAAEIPTDTSIIVNLPMAYNFQADVNVWKPFYVTFNLNRRATNAENARSMQALNYLTVTPRIVSRFIEIYVPFTFAEVQGNTIGAGLKLGPLYMGSSSIVSALASNENKAVDFHFGLRAGFGKRFK